MTRVQSAVPISVVVLTLNEEKNLSACLAAVADWADQVFVVDAGSTDGTTAIAEDFGAVVVAHAFETHMEQWRWALDNLPLRSEWVLALDADQQVSPELAHELCALTPADLNGIDGVYIRRQQWFRGRWIKHGGYYPKCLLKMFRRGAVTFDPRDLVDHHFYVPGGVKELRHDLIEANQKENDLGFWIRKHIHYAALLAREEYQWRTASENEVPASQSGTPNDRAIARKRAWRRMPLYVRPFLYFIYRYFVRLGFLDGKQGAIFHFMQAFWFRLLIDINLDELLQRGSAELSPKSEPLIPNP